MQRRRLLVALVLLATAACNRSKPPPDHTDLHPEETAVTAAVPTTAPLGEQVTTVEAAQRLLDLFAHLDSSVARLLVQKGAADAEVDRALESVYVGQELEAARKRFAGEANSHLQGYARPQPNVVFRAREVVDARRQDCVVVTGTADLRPRYTNPVPVIDGIFVMVMQDGMMPSGDNPTSWRLLAVGKPEASTEVQAICPAL